MIVELVTKYPTLMRLLDGPGFRKDLEKAMSYFNHSDPVESVHEASLRKEFTSGLLVYHLGAALGKDDWFAPVASLIEADLTKISSFVKDFDSIRSAYRDKLLNDAQFDDVRYEIASAAIFCDVLDGGSVSLEEPLLNSKKNPDVTGIWKGQKTRVEVTVVHENWPPAISLEAYDIARSADVEGGYVASFNIPLANESDAKRAKKLIEQLFVERAEHPGQEVIWEGFTFKAKRDEFRCDSEASPLRYIEFHEFDFREIRGAAVTRSTITKDEAKDLQAEYPKPERVVTWEDLKKHPTAHKTTPIGQKIYQMLEEKMLKQCEPRSINVIVLGQPMRMNDNGVYDALLGSPFLLVSVPKPGQSDARPAETLLTRTGLGPFVPKKSVEDSDFPPEKKEAILGEIERFRIVSGVLILRIDPE